MIRTRDELIEALWECAQDWRDDWNAYERSGRFGPPPQKLRERLAAVLDDTENLKLVQPERRDKSKGYHRASAPHDHLAQLEIMTR